MAEWIPNLKPDLRIVLQRCLAKIEPIDRNVATSKGKKSPNKYFRVTGNVPEDLGIAFHNLKGPVGHNLERALRLFMEAQPTKKGK